MEITLYRRTYPVAGAPVILSVSPFACGPRYTYPAGGRVYEAAYSEVRVLAPAGARVDMLNDRVRWDGDRGRVRSTAQEVFDLAHAGRSGFRLTN